MDFINQFFKDFQIINKENSVEIIIPYSFHNEKDSLILSITYHDGLLISDNGYTFSVLKQNAESIENYNEKIKEILYKHGDYIIENECIKTYLPSLESNATYTAFFRYISVLSLVYHVVDFPLLEEKAKVF